MCKIIISDTFKDVFLPLTFNINEALASIIPDKTIGDKIKKLRVSLGLTQLQFSKSIHCGFGTVTKWEQNLNSPSIKHLNEICAIYKLSCNYFK